MAIAAELPPEIMDRIALETISKRDLISLTMLNRSWRHTLWPDQVQYQRLVINCGDTKKWEELSSVPRRAKLVRRLEVRENRYTVLLPSSPAPLGQRWTDAQKTSVDKSARHFASLMSVVIACGNITGLVGFFETIKVSCPQISEMSIVGVHLQNSTNSEPERHVIAHLGGYTRFRWTCSSIVNDGGQLLLSLAGVLSRSPRLIRLYISQYDSPSTLPATFSPFWETRMPQLHTLTLDKVASHELTPSFLSAHPTLESVVLWDESPLSVIVREFPDDCLPNIKTLRMRCSRVEAYRDLILPLSDGTHRPLHELRIWLDPFIASMQQTHNVLSFCRAIRGLSTLRRLEFAARSMSSRNSVPVALIGPAVPHVTDVAVHPLHESEEATENWIYAMSCFAGLESLFGFGEKLSPEHRSIVISELRIVCPRLKAVDGTRFPVNSAPSGIVPSCDHVPSGPP